MKNKISRRNILKQMAVGSVAFGAANAFASFAKGNLKIIFNLKAIFIIPFQDGLSII